MYFIYRTHFPLSQRSLEQHVENRYFNVDYQGFNVLPYLQSEKPRSHSSLFPVFKTISGNYTAEIQCGFIQFLHDIIDLDQFIIRNVSADREICIVKNIFKVQHEDAKKLELQTLKQYAPILIYPNFVPATQMLLVLVYQKETFQILYIKQI